MSHGTVAVGLDELQAALDASCAALLALQDAAGELALGGDALRSPQDAERQAIELVQRAVRELRCLIGMTTGSPLALGFVRAAADETQVSPEVQPRSLRIA